jgi:hypothetical protein
MRIYFADELGSVYAIVNGVLQFAPMHSSEYYAEDFSPVEPELVGEEIVTFQGKEMTLYEVYKIVTKELLA